MTVWYVGPPPPPNTYTGATFTELQGSSKQIKMGKLLFRVLYGPKEKRPNKWNLFINCAEMFISVRKRDGADAETTVKVSNHLKLGPITLIALITPLTAITPITQTAPIDQ